MPALNPNSEYESYTEWKGWHIDFTYSDAAAIYYEKEFGAIVHPGKRIIEIGFGSGSFLAWAKQRGAEVYGVELQEVILVAAHQHGFTAVGNIDDLMPHRKEGLDAVIALDVFEHLHTNTISTMLESVDNLLKPGGLLIVRAPNSSSPFGQVNQHGDATHRTGISPNLLRQLAVPTKLRVTQVRNEARVPAKNGFLHRIGKQFQFALRELINVTVARVYGFPDSVLDMNVIIVLKKQA